MIIQCLGSSNSRIQLSLTDFILKAIAKRSLPILITGEEGFPYHHYFQRGRYLGFSQHSLGKLLVCQSVNMYHLRDIIKGMPEEMKNGAFPILVNFSKNYLDENVTPTVSDYLFTEDLSLLQDLSRKFSLPAFIWEEECREENSRRKYLQKLVHNHASCVLDWSEQTPRVTKNTLSRQERLLIYENSRSGILRISGELIPKIG
jgi:hypothetical protein